MNTTIYQVTERLPVWCRIRVYAHCGQMSQLYQMPERLLIAGWCYSYYGRIPQLIKSQRGYLLLEDARVTTITVSSQREATCVWKIPQSLWTNATTLSSHREATYCWRMLQLLRTYTINLSSHREAICCWRMLQSLLIDATTVSSHREAPCCWNSNELHWDG